jgi:hypothetical protein
LVECLEPELHRSRSARDDNRNRLTNARRTPPYNHSYSTSSASKMQSHILRRLASMRRATTGNSNGSSDTPSGQAKFDFLSIPTDLSTGKYY